MAAERGVAARPATSTAAAGSMPGGRGGKSGKDAEHQRRYVVDADGEERFGADGRYAPPVIGETVAEREQRDIQESTRHRRDR